MTERTQLLVYTFDGVAKAEEARQAIRLLDEQLGPERIGDIAVIAKHSDGSIEFWETAEADEIRRDANLGSMIGWLLGAIGTVLGAPLGPRQGLDAGAGFGSEAAERLDVGFGDADLRHFGEQLVAGSSALIALVPPSEVQAIVAELNALGGTLAQTTLPDETLARLNRSASEQ